MSHDPAKSYQDLIGRFKEHSLLRSCASLLGWDERTYMPHNGSAHRAEQMALLARLTHEQLTDPEIGRLLSDVEQSTVVRDAASVPAANVREIRRLYDRAVKLPKALVEEIARVTTRAQQIWQEARANNDFARFEPWLDRVVALKREEACCITGSGVLYDALLDEFEPGATAHDIARTFAALREELTPLVEAIGASRRRPRREVLEREFPTDAQETFGQLAAAAIGFDFQSGRLDVTTHPFCTGIGPGDCRITTRYNPRHFNDAFFGILHEAGHGIYDQGLDPEHFGTPAGSAVSLGIHESQSRMWENQVGRSRQFWEHFFPKAKERFPGALADVSLDDFELAINEVRPSYIRVEADEVTYNLHVIMRFELEQALISGELQAKDVPTAWNEKFKRTLGLAPPDDAKGCLQDVHWSFGGIGYFPTYTLGNMYAAQLMEQARRDLTDLDASFRRGEFGTLKAWLNEKIHRPGQRYRASELCQRVTGKPLSHQPLLTYLRTKYGRLYDLQ
jgi:carboxypeptidase Taq